VTGAVYQWLNPKIAKLRIRSVWILPIAAISSTYLAWVIAIAELVDGKFDLTGAVAIAGWLGTIGVVAAAVMLWTEREVKE
jgi:cation transporter-like permease